MTPTGMFLLTCFALLTGVCFWLYRRERNKAREYAKVVRVLEQAGLIHVIWTEDGGCEIHKSHE